MYNFYNEIVVNKLMCNHKYTSIMQVPKLEKVTLNIGIGKFISDNKRVLDNAILDLTTISGQKPFITKAKKSIANFKIRKGQSIGCKVTLRKRRMWSFFKKLIGIIIPRIRDFRGFPLSSFDGFGNYSFGIKEQIIFPEIDYDKVDCIRGLNITLTTTAKSNQEGESLLSALYFPFRK